MGKSTINGPCSIAFCMFTRGYAHDCWFILPLWGNPVAIRFTTLKSVKSHPPGPSNHKEPPINGFGMRHIQNHTEIDEIGSPDLWVMPWLYPLYPIKSLKSHFSSKDTMKSLWIPIWNAIRSYKIPTNSSRTPDSQGWCPWPQQPRPTSAECWPWPLGPYSYSSCNHSYLWKITVWCRIESLKNLISNPMIESCPEVSQLVFPSVPFQESLAQITSITLTLKVPKRVEFQAFCCKYMFKTSVGQIEVLGRRYPHAS